MRTVVLCGLSFAVSVANADDLDVIVNKNSSAASRGQAYARLTSVEFSTFAAKLAKLTISYPVLTGIGPRTKQPWFESQLTEGDRIGCTLGQLWNYHVRSEKKRGQEKIGLMLSLLEDSSIGEGRHLPLREISLYVDGLKRLPNPPLPTIDDILSRLDRLARDPKQTDYFRRQLLEILYLHSDPNQYLDLAIELSATEDTPLRRAEVFRHCTPSRHATKLSIENRNKYLLHSYSLLEEIDDGHSGHGYFLARHIDDFVGRLSVRTGRTSFVPDPKSRQYQGSHGLNNRFFQDTVVNALQWWTEHKAQYVGDTP